MTFDEHLAREILASERVRIGILIRVVVALLVFFSVFAVLFRGTYLQFFAGPGGMLYAGAILVALLVYELAIRSVMGRWLEQGRSIRPGLRYLNALVETSVPSLMILALSQTGNPAYVMQGPAAYLYGVFIVLSTLRLDYRLSVFTGVVAAAEYVALCLHFGERAGIVGTPLGLPPFYLGKAMVLLLAGFAAAFVAHQLKRRVGNAFRAQEERQRIVASFGQQVSPEIVEALLRGGPGMESRRAVVCILFMDIRNFTPMVERMTPEEIVALQNSVFSVGIEVVNRHRGVINQFLGDGFMATFGAPVSGGEDCRNALAAARELVARLPMRVGIGLHVGEAVTGNIGSEQRKQYSITGDVVILASRIEQLNKEYDSRILASREVLAAAGEQNSGHATLGPVHVKGRNEPIEIYKLA